MKPIMDMEAKNKWLQVVQSIITLIFLPWAGWITATLVVHSIAIAEIKTWQDNRPRFVTQDQMQLAVLESERQLREKLTVKLDNILQAVTAMDRRISEHIAANEAVRVKSP